MPDLLKIIVTDRYDKTHEFCCDDDVECYFDPEPDGLFDKDWITITTRSFDGGSKKYISEEISFFQKPRRVDLIYASYEKIKGG